MSKPDNDNEQLASSDLFGWSASIEGHRDGETYVRSFDYARLNRQARVVWDVMDDSKWRTLREIADSCSEPEASISARLRDFRKEKFGGHDVERRRRGGGEKGLFEYRLLANKKITDV